MGLWTTAGLNLLGSAVQANGVNCAISYIGVSPGCGTLATALANGTPYTTLSLDGPGIPAALLSGRQLTISNGTNTQTVTLSGNAALNATTLNVTSFTANAAYSAHTTGVAPTPLAADTALYGESVRIATGGGTAGVNPGETLVSAYFDGTQPTAVYMTVGYFAGSATASVGTGTLMGEDLVYWNHTINADSNMYQADATV